MRDAKKRIFLKRFINVLPWVGLGTLAYPSFKFITQSSGDKKETTVDLSSLEFSINQIDGFFIIKEKDEIKAFSSACTHLGCTLKIDLVSQKFICPCHKSEFNFNGKVLKGPATRDLDIAKTKISGNKLTVKL